MSVFLIPPRTPDCGCLHAALPVVGELASCSLIPSRFLGRTGRRWVVGPGLTRSAHTPTRPSSSLWSAQNLTQGGGSCGCFLTG